MADDFETRLQEVLRQLEEKMRQLPEVRNQLTQAGSEVLSAIGSVAPATVTTQIQTGIAGIGTAVVLRAPARIHNRPGT